MLGAYLELAVTRMRGRRELRHANSARHLNCGNACLSIPVVLAPHDCVSFLRTVNVHEMTLSDNVPFVFDNKPPGEDRLCQWPPSGPDGPTVWCGIFIYMLPVITTQRQS